MSCDLRSAAKRPVGVVGAVMLSAVAVAGCSTDFRRLETPSVASSERGAPRPSEGIGGRRSGAGAPVDRGEAWPESGPRGSLPPVTAQPVPPPAPLPATAGLSKPFDAPKAARPAGEGAGRAIASGKTVEVQSGDSLYAISKRHNVSLAELMEANNLKSPNLKPGQKLVLPQSGTRRPAARPTAIASAGGAIPPSALPAPVPAAPAVVIPAAPVVAGGTTHTVKSGELLSTIARQYKVSVADLQSVNGIADPRKVKPGTVLKIPGATGATSPAPTPIAAPVAPLPGVPQPKVINAPVPDAPRVPGAVTADAPAVTTARVASSAPVAASTAKFRWPVTGQVVQSFGKRPDGSPSDGIAVAVPIGTEIAAAGDGTVAYAGSELKGYGNLILVRHEDGWVTAYAHASEILVKRGDTVKRGQTIAKSGQTGAVDQPTLHFELREGTKPVDPVPHLGKS